MSTSKRYIKRKLKERADVSSVFKKYSIPMSDTTYKIFLQFKSIILPYRNVFKNPLRESLISDHATLWKMKPLVDRIVNPWLKRNIMCVIGPSLIISIPNSNQQLAFAITFIAPLANDLVTQYPSLFKNKREAVLYPLLAELIDLIWPELIKFTDYGLHESDIRAFKKNLKSKDSSKFTGPLAKHFKAMEKEYSMLSDNLFYYYFFTGR